MLADRFAQRVGAPPMHYLMRWRMQLAARLPSDGPARVRSVAEAVGCASEAAFSRTFSQLVGTVPAQWRQRRLP